MPYLMVDDFSAGLDLRKDAVTSPPGSLRTLDNAFITAGGQIEKRKTLTNIGICPAGTTKGVAFVGGALTVFGTVAPGSVGTLPSYVVYSRLTVADAVTIVRILDVSVFGNAAYVIARMSDDSIRHFYNGVQLAGAQIAGTNARAHKQKQYVVAGQNLFFSAVADSDDFVGTGAGVIDVTTEDAGSTELVGLEQYYNALALFGRNSIQIWSMDPDPSLNSIVQVLGNIGLVAANAVSRYGNGDVLFLSDTGIRSLRARDSSNAAVLNDLGSPIDEPIQSKRADLTAAAAEKIAAFVDPLTGHFWLAWGNEIHVLSQYPNSKVTAWATFKLPWTVDYTCIANSRVVMRVGEEIFVYGSVPPSGSPFDPTTPIGSTAAVYDATPVTIETPMLNASKPATVKHWQGIDVVCTGTWDVYVTPDLNAPATYTKIATVQNTTFEDGRIAIDMRSTHLGLKFVSVGSERAILGGFALHHDLGDDD